MQGRFQKILDGLLADYPGAVLLAVSGGADSMCMAGLFLRSGRPFALAHCNFRLRGEESDGDEAFVREWCASNGVKLHAAAFDTRSVAARTGESIEMAARRLRYEWFDTLGYDVVAVAHNANDNAETLMLNLLRGTGLRGLSGIKPSSPLPVTGSSKRLIRPLLTFSRDEITDFLTKAGSRWREDRTNAENDARRNRLRNLVFPELLSLNPSLYKTLGKDMARFAEAADVLDDYVSEFRFLVREGAPTVIDVPGLLSKRHWRYLLYRFLEPYGFSGAVLDDISGLLFDYGSGPFAGKTFSSGTHRLATAAGRLEIMPLTAGPAVVPTVVIRGPGKYCIGSETIEVEVFDKPDGYDAKQPEGVIAADARALAFPLLVRPWREGDWMVPLGMRGRKKLSDLMTGMKYSVLQKEAALVAVVPGWNAPDSEGERVAALLCSRIDTRLSVGAKTTRIVRMRFTEK